MAASSAVEEVGRAHERDHLVGGAPEHHVHTARRTRPGPRRRDAPAGSGPASDRTRHTPPRGHRRRPRAMPARSHRRRASAAPRRRFRRRVPRASRRWWRVRASGVRASTSAPLIAHALRNRPCADGMPSRQVTLLPPPDSPKIVTFAGSPPKPAMLSRTHSSAATMSSIPTLPESANSLVEVRQVEEPEHAEPMVHADHHDVVVARQVREVVERPRRRPDRHAAAVQPHEHRDATRHHRPSASTR